MCPDFRLLAQMERMGLAALLDTHFPTHGNWQGLGCGRVATIWLRAILARGDHRLVHVEPWVAQRQCSLVSLYVRWENPHHPVPGRDRPIEPGSTEAGA